METVQSSHTSEMLVLYSVLSFLHHMILFLAMGYTIASYEITLECNPNFCLEKFFVFLNIEPIHMAYLNGFI